MTMPLLRLACTLILACVVAVSHADTIKVGDQIYEGTITDRGDLIEIENAQGVVEVFQSYRVDYIDWPGMTDAVERLRQGRDVVAAAEAKRKAGDYADAIKQYKEVIALLATINGRVEREHRAADNIIRETNARILGAEAVYRLQEDRKRVVALVAMGNIEVSRSVLDHLVTVIADLTPDLRAEAVDRFWVDQTLAETALLIPRIKAAQAFLAQQRAGRDKAALRALRDEHDELVGGWGAVPLTVQCMKTSEDQWRARLAVNRQEIEDRINSILDFERISAAAVAAARKIKALLDARNYEPALPAIDAALEMFPSEPDRYWDAIQIRKLTDVNDSLVAYDVRSMRQLDAHLIEQGIAAALASLHAGDPHNIDAFTILLNTVKSELANLGDVASDITVEMRPSFKTVKEGLVAGVEKGVADLYQAKLDVGWFPHPVTLILILPTAANMHMAWTFENEQLNYERCTYFLDRLRIEHFETPQFVEIQEVHARRELVPITQYFNPARSDTAAALQPLIDLYPTSTTAMIGQEMLQQVDVLAKNRRLSRIAWSAFAILVLAFVVVRSYWQFPSVKARRYQRLIRKARPLQKRRPRRAARIYDRVISGLQPIMHETGEHGVEVLTQAYMGAATVAAARRDLKAAKRFLGAARAQFKIDEIDALNIQVSLDLHISSTTNKALKRYVRYMGIPKDDIDLETADRIHKLLRKDGFLTATKGKTEDELNHAMTLARHAAAIPGAVPCLVVVEGPDLGRQATFGSECRIGSKADSDLLLTDDSVSTRHAIVEALEDGVYLRDLDSTNGTYFGGDKVEAAVLMEDGAEFGCGSSLIRYFCEPRIFDHARMWPLESLARCSIAQGHVDAARNFLRVAKKCDAENAVIYLLEAEIAVLQNDVQAAATAYQKAIDVDSENFTGNLALGRLLVERKSNSEAAEKCLKRAVSLNAKSDEAFYLLARLHVNNGEHERGGKALKKALALKPDNEEYQRLQSAIEAVTG